jgi:hypothetical protein
VALFEAAHVPLARAAKWSALMAWGVRLAQRRGAKRAKVAVARRLAGILHRMWAGEADFRYGATANGDGGLIDRRVPPPQQGSSGRGRRWRQTAGHLAAPHQGDAALEIDPSLGAILAPRQPRVCEPAHTPSIPTTCERTSRKRMRKGAAG